MAQTRVFRSQVLQRPSLFCMRKTANQSTGTSGNNIVMTWQEAEEYNNETNCNVSNNSWTAPSDGWLDTTASISVIGGAAADDSMRWGFWVNNAEGVSYWDNWYQFSKGAGIEYPTSVHGAFQVSAGDVVQVWFTGCQNDITIMGGASFSSSYWTGRFVPYIR